jgi:hypothetical protein
MDAGNFVPPRAKVLVSINAWPTHSAWQIIPALSLIRA